MTVEEAIDILTDIRDDVFAPMETEEMIVVDELERKALSMAIRSLEAWEKVKEEIKQEQEFAWGLYNDGLQDALNIIDKHLKEVENDE